MNTYFFNIIFPFSFLTIFSGSFGDPYFLSFCCLIPFAVLEVSLVVEALFIATSDRVEELERMDTVRN